MVEEGFHPFGQGVPLHLILLRVLALDLQDEHGAVRQPDQEIRPVLVDHALEDVEDLKAEVIVLDPGRGRGRTPRIRRGLDEIARLWWHPMLILSLPFDIAA